MFCYPVLQIEEFGNSSCKYKYEFFAFLCLQSKLEGDNIVNGEELNTVCILYLLHNFSLSLIS